MTKVGTVLDALASSPHAENTVVILTSDHGFHVGGKESIYKQTLWGRYTYPIYCFRSPRHA